MSSNTTPAWSNWSNSTSSISGGIYSGSYISKTNSTLTTYNTYQTTLQQLMNKVNETLQQQVSRLLNNYTLADLEEAFYAGNLAIAGVPHTIDITKDGEEIKVKGKCRIKLLDGTLLDVDENGNFVINDKDAKKIYKGNRTLNFNKYLNASDILEEFMKFISNLNINRKEFLNLPIELFIAWLVITAAEADEEIIPETEKLQLTSMISTTKYSKCKCCGKFIKKKNARLGIYACNGDHAQKILDKE